MVARDADWLDGCLVARDADWSCCCLVARDAEWSSAKQQLAPATTTIRFPLRLLDTGSICVDDVTRALHNQIKHRFLHLVSRCLKTVDTCPEFLVLRPPVTSPAPDAEGATYDEEATSNIDMSYATELSPRDNLHGMCNCSGSLAIVCLFTYPIATDDFVPGQVEGWSGTRYEH